MSRPFFLALATSCCFAGCLAFLRVEAFAADFSEQLKDYSAEHLAKAQAIAADYQARPTHEQDENTLVLYLIEANWAVYLALEAYRTENRALPGNLDELVSTGLLKEWPGNPFDDWKPIEVLDQADGFKAGCFVWSICPSSHYSRVWENGAFTTRPLSFQFSVLGPAQDHPYSAKIEPLEGNDWFVAPRGLLMTLGAYRESTAQTEAKARKRAEEAKQ